MGALRNTLSEAIEKDMCDFLIVEVTDDASVGIWANTLVKAIIDKKWQRVKVIPESYSWEKVADFFTKGDVAIIPQRVLFDRYAIETVGFLAVSNNLPLTIKVQLVTARQNSRPNAKVNHPVTGHTIGIDR